MSEEKSEYTMNEVNPIATSPGANHQRSRRWVAPNPRGAVPSGRTAMDLAVMGWTRSSRTPRLDGGPDAF
jgi:hypothetical protein